ncbi:hypothetical protein Tco_0937434 [Tanacetum coccineum]|uniref:Uncharacterized protein n=1 Tax=Tanacetum coccineum TaxID=301880 RepID=A0ABQ5DLA7_9ASTR
MYPTQDNLEIRHAIRPFDRYLRYWGKRLARMGDKSALGDLHLLRDRAMDDKDESETDKDECGNTLSLLRGDGDDDDDT